MTECAISFVGDIALNDNYVDMYVKRLRPFDDVVAEIPPSDEIVGNLECFAAGENGVNLQKHPRLETTVRTLEYLEQVGLSIACLANNHVYDHLEDGFTKTKHKLRSMDIACIGAAMCETASKAPLIIERSGITIAMLNYVTADTNPGVPGDAGVYLNSFREPVALSDIRALRDRADFVIVSLHWGGEMENAYYPDWQQTGVAHRLIDGGADLIVGHHSHTLQPYEIYKGKYIFYSLGNFCFSEFTSNGTKVALQERRHTESVVLTARFRKNGYEVELLPFENVDGALVPKPSVKKKLKWRSRVFAVIFLSEYVWAFYRFGFRYIRPVVHYALRKDRSLSDKVLGLEFAKLTKLIRR